MKDGNPDFTDRINEFFKMINGQSSGLIDIYNYFSNKDIFKA